MDIPDEPGVLVTPGTTNNDAYLQQYFPPKTFKAAPMHLSLSETSSPELDRPMMMVPQSNLARSADIGRRSHKKTRSIGKVIALFTKKEKKSPRDEDSPPQKSAKSCSDFNQLAGFSQVTQVKNPLLLVSVEKKKKKKRPSSMVFSGKVDSIAAVPRNDKKKKDLLDLSRKTGDLEVTSTEATELNLSPRSRSEDDGVTEAGSSIIIEEGSGDGNIEGQAGDKLDPQKRFKDFQQRQKKLVEARKRIAKQRMDEVPKLKSAV